MTPPRGENTIRNKLVELYDELLGVQVPHSPDVEAAYRLFVDVVTNGPRSRDQWVADYDWFAYWECAWWSDLFLFDGILGDVRVVRENDDGWSGTTMTIPASGDFSKAATGRTPTTPRDRGSWC